MAITRRAFVSTTAALAAGSVFSGLAGAQTIVGRVSNRRTRVLTPVVVLNLRGGVDGLSLLVPHGDSWYRQHRADIAIDAVSLDNDGLFGLHPLLAGVLPMFASGRAMAIPAVGLENSTRSHRREQARLMRHVESAFGTRAQVIDVPGWDTHHDQGPSGAARIAAPMERLQEVLNPLLADSASGTEPLIVTISEFGRTVKQNESRGTDHGGAFCSLVIGAPSALDRVAAGLRQRRRGPVVGCWPGLAPHQMREGRELTPTTPLEALLAAIAAA